MSLSYVVTKFGKLHWYYIYKEKIVLLLINTVSYCIWNLIFPNNKYSIGKMPL